MLVERIKISLKDLQSFQSLKAVKIQFTDTHLKVEGFSTSKKKNKQKLNWIRLAEHSRIPTDCKYNNPRIKYDGINWYITVGIEYEDSDAHKSDTHQSNEGIGIDLGIKDLAICSDGNKYQNINKTQKNKEIREKKTQVTAFYIKAIFKK